MDFCFALNVYDFVSESFGTTRLKCARNFRKTYSNTFCCVVSRSREFNNDNDFEIIAIYAGRERLLPRDAGLPGLARGWGARAKPSTAARRNNTPFSESEIRNK